MVDKHPFYLNVISDCLGLKYGKFYRWYKEVLSGFRSEEVQKGLHEHDFESVLTNSKGEKQSISVPILKPEHIGSHMTIDEKHINQEFYTVLSNGQTGRVALMVASMNPQEVGKCLMKFGDKLQIVSTLSRDLSPTYQAIASTHFKKAKQVADKYHIIAEALESVQDVRVRLRQEALSNQRKEEQAAKLALQAYRKKEKEGTLEATQKAPQKYSPQKIEVGAAHAETLAELLARSRYLLFKKPTQWNSSQSQRAKLLFKHFPALKEAHQAVNLFRKWYEPNGIKNQEWNYLTAETALLDWIYWAQTSGIDEILNLTKTIEKNQEVILNYHLNYKTNAMAESVNAKIENAIRLNKGARDKDFFHFRLNMMLTR